MLTWQFLYFLFNKYIKLKTGHFETRRFETWRFVNLTFCKPDVLKPDVLKPDVLWVYRWSTSKENIKTSLKFRKTLKMVVENKTEVGKLIFYSPQIANPKIIGLIPLSQIHNSFRCASPQIANLQIFMINPQIADLQNPKHLKNTAQLCLKTVLKNVFIKRF